MTIRPATRRKSLPDPPRDPDAVPGLDLCWQAGRLRFYDPAKGEFLPDFDEVKSELDAERTMRLAAEAELRMLRARLRQLGADAR